MKRPDGQGLRPRAVTFFFLFLGAIAAATWACTTTNVPTPGDEIMGNYNFTAQPLYNNCPPFPEIIDGGFTFQAAFSRQSDGGQAWVTLSTTSVDATFDGQYLTTNGTTNKQPRRFDACHCTESQVGEAFFVALLSRSQFESIVEPQPDGCPANVFTGVPQPPGDGGITPPRMTPDGFDAVWACGTLTDYLYGRSASPQCQCDDCTLVYRLSGIRR